METENGGGKKNKQFNAKETSIRKLKNFVEKKQDFGRYKRNKGFFFFFFFSE